jgi:hypothetical protein
MSVERLAEAMDLLPRLLIERIETFRLIVVAALFSFPDMTSASADEVIE